MGDPTTFGGAPLDAASLAIVEEFESAWEHGRPDVATFFSRHAGRPTRLLVELAAIDLENRLKRGDAAAVADYTGRFPELATDAVLIQELSRVAERFAARAAADTPTSAIGESAGDGGVFGIRPGDASPSAASREASLVGSRIGGVSIVRLIAEGGMGRVYEGRQDKPRRPVAVKIIKPGLVSPSLLKRFDYEAQVLGRLRHPGIAQIHTVGTHDVGGRPVPYFVMEYIPSAKTLTRYADDNKLSTHERLDLFRKVCEAVAHGHQKGVIHRDLKPGNILVDSSGQPKVIDFGVARSTDSDMALTTMQTDVGALIGTLQYMSPEQFDADPSDLDIRLDVYALGVVLYELLTGKPPYDVRQRAIHEIARVVREEEPTPISSLNKALRRDVAIIAGKCLQKDRNRRYSSATELAGDVGRYLAGEPITAAPPSFFDAVARVARRHKAAAVAVAGIALSLVAAVVGISAFAIRAERAREEATRQTAVANQERDTASAARAAEAAQRSAAQTEAIKAKRHLYLARLYGLQAAIDSPQRKLANTFYEDACTAYHDAYGQHSDPIELRLLRPSLDMALNTFHVPAKAGYIYHVFSSDLRLAAGWRYDDPTVRLWDVVTGKSLTVLEGHTQRVECVAFSIDGARLATASADKSVRIWDTATCELLTVLEGLTSRVILLAFSNDGSRVATTSLDHEARLWCAMTGKQVAVLKGHQAPISRIAFSPDGTRLATATGSGSRDATARLWNAETGKSLAVLMHPSSVDRLAFSPSGTHLATTTAAAGTTIQLWNAMTGERLWESMGHETRIHAIAFSADSECLATGSADATARLFSTATGELLLTLQGHEGLISSVAFTRDSKRVATGSHDQSVRIWSALSGKPLATLKGHKALVASVAFSADGSVLASASADFTARRWDTSIGDSLAVMDGHTSTINTLAFDPQGKRLVTGSNDRTVRMWDVATCEELAVLRGHDAAIRHVAISVDGSRVVTASDDKTARIWDGATGGLLAVIGGHESRITSLALSPDGKRLATGSADKTVRIWDMETGSPLAVLAGHAGEIHFIAYSPDGSRIFCGQPGVNSVRVWDLNTQEPLGNLTGRGLLKGMALSPDGRFLGAVSGGVRVWNVVSGEVVADLIGGSQVVFSPDSRWVATGSYGGSFKGEYDMDIAPRIWDAATGNLLAVLKGHERSVASLALSPDGKRLATGSYDTTVRVWDTATGDLLAVLHGNQQDVQKLAFSPDGSFLANTDGLSAQTDHRALRLWGLSNADIVGNRLSAKAIRERVESTVDQWFNGDLESVKKNLAAAKAMMPAADWREAANMVLIRANAAAQKELNTAPIGGPVSR